MILKYLKQTITGSFNFDHREKYKNTLSNFDKIVSNNKIKDIDIDLKQGIDVIKEKFKKYNNNELKSFIKKLKKVYFYQIELDKSMDPIHYFEVMNARGEQLSKEDLVKSTLMSFISKSDQKIFANIWDNCTNMDSYVQLQFSSKVRKEVFGNDLNTIPSLDWKKYQCIKKCSNEGIKSYSIKQIKKITPEELKKLTVYEDNNHEKRFESIIDFPHFLGHVIKAFISYKNISNLTVANESLINDQKLLDYINDIIKNGVINNEKINSSTKSLDNIVKEFIMFLLRSRFLFDKYIIKREFVINSKKSQNGKWQIQQLKAFKREKSYGFVKTETITKDKNIKDLILLQSLLRVSFISLKSMDWITELIKWLNKNIDNFNSENYRNAIEDFIVKKVKETDFYQDNNYNQGLDTPHIIFNYLEYLLCDINSNYSFETNRTVEHFYPQNPPLSSKTKQWKSEKERDYFGNLYLISRNLNSRMQNSLPTTKLSTFKEELLSESNKVKYMFEELEKYSGNKDNKDIAWIDELSPIHGKKMIDIIIEAVKKNEERNKKA